MKTDSFSKLKDEYDQQSMMNNYQFVYFTFFEFVIFQE